MALGQDEEGALKIVMTGSASDPPSYQRHLRSKQKQKAIEKRFKDDKDPLELVIVRDMWLTGFDVPCAHTLYLDKPIQGHTLMQAIARVNRVFQNKPHGLVVDYLGLAERLKRAVGQYGGGKGKHAWGDVSKLALPVLLEKFGVVKDMFHGFDSSGFFGEKPTERLTALAAAVDFICGQEEPSGDKGGDRKKRFLDAMSALNKAAALALHLEEARHLRDELAFFQAVQRNITKYTVGTGGKTYDELDAAIRQIVSGAITSDGVIDIFDAVGIKKPDISILSDTFLESLKANPYRNLQLELLKKLLNDEIKNQRKQNVIQARKFSEMLERTILAYQNRSLESAQVILELIELAKEMRDAPKRGDKLGLTHDELAFYDALADHGNVREVMTDEILAKIAQELVETIRNSVTIDWTQKESVRAKMRTRVKRLLRKHGYPPDKREEAIVTVLRQAEVVCLDWAAYSGRRFE